MMAKNVIKKVLITQEKGSENNNKATGNGMEIIRYVRERVRNRINQAMEAKEERGN